MTYRAQFGSITITVADDGSVRVGTGTIEPEASRMRIQHEHVEDLLVWLRRSVDAARGSRVARLGVTDAPPCETTTIRMPGDYELHIQAPRYAYQHSEPAPHLSYAFLGVVAAQLVRDDLRLVLEYDAQAALYVASLARRESPDKTIVSAKATWVDALKDVIAQWEAADRFFQGGEL